MKMWTGLAQGRFTIIEVPVLSSPGNFFRRCEQLLTSRCSGTRRNIGEDLNRHEHSCENLKCRTTISFQGRTMHHAVNVKSNSLK
jgi:hypothetical protein